MKKILAICCLLFPVFAFSQTDSMSVKPTKPRLLWSREVSNTLLTGYNYQTSDDTSASRKVKRNFLEVGFHRTLIASNRHGPATFTYGGSVLAALDKSKIVGFRASAWTSGLIEFGLSTTYYTNFKQGNLKITPELGFGAAGFKLAVGYNIPTFRNKDFDALRYANTQFSINYLIKLKRIKYDARYAQY
jgi:hypothetical protein